MYLTSIQAFIEPVPVCGEADAIATVLKLFSQGHCDRVVVVGENQQLKGLITLHTLTAYLSSRIGEQDLSFSSLPSTLDLQQPLTEIFLSVVEPLVTVPEHSTLSQLGLFLRSQASGYSPAVAIVNSQGQCLGLLDSQRLLHFLVVRLGLPDILPDQNQSVLEPPPSGGSYPVPAEALEPPKSEFSPLQNSANASSVLGISPLVQLLEQLPLPLMLQNGTGQVLAHNQVWRHQVSEFLDPHWIRQHAAALLELPISPPESPSIAEVTDQLLGTAAHWESSSSSAHSTSHLEQTAPDTFGASQCQLGTEPNTCICVCSMKNGQERVWQFTKIFLGLTSSYLRLNLPEKRPPPLTLDEQSQITKRATPSFQLASLVAIPEHFVPLLSSGSVSAVQLPELSAGMGMGGSGVSGTDHALWLVWAQDITEQYQVAKELAAKNADLVQLNRLKDEFLACISHELKTPLTAVLGLSSLLKDQAVGGLNQRQARYARLIHQSGRHLITMVNDILDLTRMETNQLELILEPVHINNISDRAYEQALSLQSSDDTETALIPTDPPAEAIRFTLEIAPDLESIVADELRLRQMLVNLLSNALKFTEAGGEIGLKVSRWEGWVAFTVWDTGIGIPEDKQHLIFQKFQQIENPLTRRFSGKGLGLVLTQRLARLHGGDITFTSKTGEGSQFTLLLPPLPPQAIPPAPLNPSPPAHLPEARATSKPYNRLVLIVEAVPRFIEDLNEQLAGLGYRVAIARSGTEALEKVRRLQPCAVFLNPLLPLLSGWDVLTLLKADPETRHVPVVVTATRGEKDQAYRNQANDVLSLPIQNQALQQVLAHLDTQQTAKQWQQQAPQLTVLHLSGTDQPSELNGELTNFLHLHHHKLLQSDDLEQAELLARVWKPDVILLDAAIADPYEYLTRLQQHSFLMSLPLVITDPATIQIANRIPGLSVFPCLPSSFKPGADTMHQPDVAVLLQVIQVAAGFSWKHCILVVDTAVVVESSELRTNLEAKGTQANTEWLRALEQYIQTGGFKTVMGRSWHEVQQQVHHQSIDLLLVNWTDNLSPIALADQLRALQQIETQLPILVIDHRSSSAGSSSATLEVLQAIAIPILPASTSMKALLDHLHQALSHPKV